MTKSDNVEVLLHQIAHCRTGDKGNRVNASVIAYVPEVYPILVEQVTISRIGKLIAHRDIGDIDRYELPNLWALNFVIEDALEGGVNGSLNLDGHGKTLSYLFLALEMIVPRGLLATCCEVRSANQIN